MKILYGPKEQVKMKLRLETETNKKKENPFLQNVWQPCEKHNKKGEKSPRITLLLFHPVSLIFTQKRQEKQREYFPEVGYKLFFSVSVFLLLWLAKKWKLLLLLTVIFLCIFVLLFILTAGKAYVCSYSLK